MTQALVRASFRRQATVCRDLGSPFTAKLLDLLADRLDLGTAVGRAVLDWQGDPAADALALRLAGALHALVLTGEQADLIKVYPPHEIVDDERLWLAVRTALETEDASILRFIQSPPQTNEVARSAALAGGFLTIAAITSLPLVLLEIGASAGLNLHWDRYGYDLGGLRINQATGRPLLIPAWEGPQPPAASVVVSERAGCDRATIDVSSPKAVLRLRAYVWADQADRLARLDQALAIARSSPLPITSADAADWVPARLAERRENAVTVLCHSIVWQYISAPGQERLKRAIADAGQRADAQAPFAWLRMEPESPEAAGLRLTLWPKGETLLLADVDYHGRWLRWRADAAALRALIDARH
ncbi:MAG: DUF2332 family protein [Alphaproteobacteria bacterium]